MSSKIFRRLPLLLAIAIAASALARGVSPETFPGQSRVWIHYESPNFELFSANDDRDSRDVLEKMELLRAVFLDTFKLVVRLPQPVTIYYFDREKDFNGYLPKNRRGDVEWAGFCQNDLDRSVIMLAPARDSDTACEVVYHEYIHYLFRIAEQAPPPWFNEGMAELYSTMQEDDQWLQLGQPVAGRVYELRQGHMLPFEQLFSVTPDSPVFRDSNHTGIFYAQSWALLHYLCYGENRVPPEKLELFLRAAGSPKMQERPEQFRVVTRELLGLDYPELQDELERYITRGRFRGRKVPRPAIAAKSSYPKRVAPPAEMTARLAELSLRFTQDARARWTILDLLGRNPDCRLHELLASIATREDEPDVARDHWNQAFELGTTNTAVFRELSRSESNSAFGEFNLDFRLPDERAVRMRTLLKKSIASAPEQSQGYEMLAWVEASANKPDFGNINLVQQRFKTLNDKPRTLLALVLVRLRRGESQTALELLDRLAKLDPNDWVKCCAEITRARIENRPVDQARFPSSLAARSGGIKLVLPNLGIPH